MNSGKTTKERGISRMRLALVPVILVLFLQGCGQGMEPRLSLEPVREEAFLLDTFCTITVYGVRSGGRDAAAQAIQAGWDVCRQYEALLSKTAEGSDIWRINGAGGAFTECDPVTVGLVRKAQAVSEASEGCFDITIGSVQELYDFHSKNPSVPSAEDVERLLAHVGYRLVETEGNGVRIRDPEGRIDLGGIAKGAVADAVCAEMAERGVTSAVVNLGGNIALIGDKSGADFHIGVEKPFGEEGETAGVLSLRDATVVTSGIYQRCFEKDGKFYHHVLDPRTGWPADSGLASVTVVSGRGHSADCDALSTACLVMGRERGMALIESLEGFEAVMIGTDGTVCTSDGCPFAEMP